MNRRLNVNSSDLETAREAAARARGVRTGPAGTEAPYVHFSGATPAPRTLPSAVAGDDLGDGSWRGALLRALELTSGNGILVMDENALIIAAEGPWESMSAEQFERVGPRLNAALDHASQIEGDAGPCRALAIQTGSVWLTGIRMAGERTSDQLTIGIVAPMTLSVDVQLKVERLIRRALG